VENQNRCFKRWRQMYFCTFFCLHQFTDKNKDRDQGFIRNCTC